MKHFPVTFKNENTEFAKQCCILRLKLSTNNNVFINTF